MVGGSLLAWMRRLAQVSLQPVCGLRWLGENLSINHLGELPTECGQEEISHAIASFRGIDALRDRIQTALKLR